MNKPYEIKFNRKWLKLKNFDLANHFKLRWVHRIFAGDISAYFLEYDTTDDSGAPYFKLPTEACIILFLEQDYKLLTTIRSYTNSKYAFYKSLEGELVKVKIVA